MCTNGMKIFRRTMLWDNRFYRKWAMIVGCLTVAPQTSLYAANAASLVWDEAAGVVVQTSIATVQMDRSDNLPAPVLKFAGGGEVELKNPQVAQPDATRLKLTYRAAAPGGVALKVVRELTLTSREANTELVEAFQITPDKPITADLEIRRPFTISGAKGASRASAVCPLFNGWAKPYSLSETALDVEYRVGNVLGGKDVERLALPVIQLDKQGAWRAALSSDCRFSALFSVSAANETTVQGVVRYRYACSRVPLKGTETRQFGLWLTPPPPAGEPFGKSVDSFFRLMLPDVPPGPKWLHEIAMVYYDYLSENGQGWEKDVNELARLLKPDERRRVALCFHGWYESLGGYGYDDSTGKMKTSWTAMGRTRKVPMTQEEMKRRLGVAKQLGFRVMLYFGDGVIQDSKSPSPGCYYPDWNYEDANGKRITGWEGPDTWGTTYVRNPSNPEVVAWYGRYLKALLAAYGSELDGFVWDETHYIKRGQIAQKPEPVYCDQGMMDLLAGLRRQVKAADPEKVFLASDCVGPDEPGWGNVNYAMVADGTFQDSWCKPDRWSFGLFPNWRNTFWSCIWAAESHFSWMRWGVENFGTPVAISNGFGDDRGPSEWNPKYRKAVLELFHKRLTKTPVRFLSVDPQILLATSPEAPPPSDPIPVPAAGERNWALASNGARATASSALDAQSGPMGLIDGVRDDSNWTAGHGWAGQIVHAAPQWVEIAFPQPRPVSRFVIVNYADKRDPTSVIMWGVVNYDIEIWDASSNAWKPTVSENQNRVMVNRVHVLEKPVETSKFRVAIKDVAPFDDIARLLQVEAWGNE
ncbi:MAG: hypothetical protein IT426_06620 [Pirellulales bacterium]|nr:hypothetical protein [Pirellulales bacterium]